MKDFSISWTKMRSKELSSKKRAGLYNGQVGVFLSGKTEPGLKTLQKLINYFDGVSIEWLILGVGKPGY
ncbi:MAG TPA: hypothetical protein PKJ63_01485 [Cyclobacteriaceae bacterium]|nr:hypothetical protein [Cyclobacteriaceae bacterium]